MNTSRRNFLRTALSLPAAPVAIPLMQILPRPRQPRFFGGGLWFATMSTVGWQAAIGIEQISEFAELMKGREL